MSNTWDRHNLPFIWGAQYYRAPTPEPEHWQADMALAKDIGMTDLKFWVQWRVSSPAEGEYWFDDIDRLMDLAADKGFRATLNVIYDVLPQWVLAKHPDCLMVTQSGRPVRLIAGASRQVGGYPGPCLNHPGARDIRRDFTRAVVERYRGHPAMFMWDVWNEPEQCAPHRAPNVETLTCYCPVCVAGFRDWLVRKYGDIERLNKVWGRYYRTFEDVEVPLSVQGLTNMVDWRLFMLDTVTEEAAWRVDLAKRLDDDHPVYTHVVPTVAMAGWGFNQITCTDDFALGAQGDVFAGTVNRFPVMPVKVMSASGDKVCYNVESHLNGGNTAYHPRPLSPERLNKDFLVQIGQGIRGFMFWQFHAESIGLESPAWGLTDAGGHPRRAYESAGKFHRAVGPLFETIMRTPPPEAKVGIYLGAANEIFQWCIGRMGDAGKNLLGYTELMFWNSIPCRYVPSAAMTDEGLSGYEALILPEAYCMSRPEADAIARWVEAGGLLVAEAHTAGYNFTTGRHEGPMPGVGLAERFGLRELEPHAQPAAAATAGDRPAEGIQQDVIVAMGGKFRPDLVAIRLTEGDELTFGYKRCAGLEVDPQYVLARYLNGTPAVALVPVGAGAVLYGGSNFGQVALSDGAAIGRLIVERIADKAPPPCQVQVSGDGRAHLDLLLGPDGAPMYVALNDGDTPCGVSWATDRPLRGVLTGAELTPADGRVTCQMQGDFADLFVPRE